MCIVGKKSDEKNSRSLAGWTLLPLISLLVAFDSSAALPNFTWAVSESRNGIDADSGIATDSVAMPITSGGGSQSVSVSGQTVVLVSSFGQSFAGGAVSYTAKSSLLTDGDALYSEGAAFLEEEDIFRRGLLEVGNPDALNSLTGQDGVARYDREAIEAAEKEYRKALLIDPFSEEAVTGIIGTRLAVAYKTNLVWDIRQKNIFTSRFSNQIVPAPADPADESGVRLGAEIGLIEETIVEQKEAVEFLLDLFGDPLYRGAGAVLRQQAESSDPELVESYFRVIMGSVDRLAKSQKDLGSKKLELYLFDEGLSNSRSATLVELDEASAYVASVLQFVSPFASQANFPLPEITDPSPPANQSLNFVSVSSVNRASRELNEVAFLSRQGFTPYGFVPDFVPYVQANAHESNLHTYNEMRGHRGRCYCGPSR